LEGREIVARRSHAIRLPGASALVIPMSIGVASNVLSVVFCVVAERRAIALGPCEDPLSCLWRC
jgi:hypothetical protein